MQFFGLFAGCIFFILTNLIFDRIDLLCANDLLTACMRHRHNGCHEHPTVVIRLHLRK